MTEQGFKVGDRVLVEAEVTHVFNDGEFRIKTKCKVGNTYGYVMGETMRPMPPPRAVMVFRRVGDAEFIEKYYGVDRWAICESHYGDRLPHPAHAAVNSYHGEVWYWGSVRYTKDWNSLGVDFRIDDAEPVEPEVTAKAKRDAARDAYIEHRKQHWFSGAQLEIAMLEAQRDYEREMEAGK